MLALNGIGECMQKDDKRERKRIQSERKEASEKKDWMICVQECKSEEGVQHKRKILGEECYREREGEILPLSELPMNSTFALALIATHCSKYYHHWVNDSVFPYGIVSVTCWR